MRAATWLFVGGGILLVIAVGALIGNRDDSGEAVPAPEWVQNVCGSVAVWRGQMEVIVEDVRTPSAVAPGGEEPQSETPQGRTALVRQGLERAIVATETMIDGLENAGAPDTENGEAAAEAISSWANGARNDLEQAEESLEEEADSTEESIEQFSAAASTIGSVVESGRQTVGNVFREDPDLASAFTSASTCRELGEEGGA